MDLSDYLYYFNDLIKFGTARTGQIIRSAFDAYITRPLLRMVTSDSRLEVKHGLLVLTECLKILKDKQIVEAIVGLLIGPTIDQCRLEAIQQQEQVYVPLVYKQKHESDEYYWDKYRSDIVGHCLKVFDQIESF